MRGQCVLFPDPASYLHERTYHALLGAWGAECIVAAECLFVDPVSDIAVLGSPDGQELSDEEEGYEALMETGIALKVSDPPTQYDAATPLVLGGKTYRRPPMPVLTDCRAWLFSRAGRWLDCVARQNGGGIGIVNAAEDIVGGMSGTPVVVDDGSAIGLVSISLESASEIERRSAFDFTRAREGIAPRPVLATARSSIANCASSFGKAASMTGRFGLPSEVPGKK
jgi:hypothetical protein